jgi:hypothetical protein
MFLKTAVGEGPVQPILYFTGQICDGAVLGRFVRALRWVQGTISISKALWGFMKVVVG